MTEGKGARGASSLVELFRRRWTEADGEYIQVALGVDLDGMLLRFLEDNSITSVVLAGPPLTPSIGESMAGKVDILADFGRETFDSETTLRHCDKAGAGITGVDALIAATGTLAVISRGKGDRLVSSLPPVHLVVATEAPVFSDLETFLKVAPRDMSFSFITGPSRTADIEKRIVLGAHGPKRIIVWGPK